MKKLLLLTIPVVAVGAGMVKKKVDSKKIKTLCDIKYTGKTIVGINTLPTQKSEWTETQRVYDWGSNNPNITDIDDDNNYKWESTYVVKETHRLILPKGFKNIGNEAFKNLPLTEVFIPEGIKSLGVDCFYNTDIETIHIPDSVERIESGAFRKCESLKNITFSEKSHLKYIGSKAFDGCSVLQEIHIPATVTTIGENAFHSCRNMKSFVIGADGRKAFCSLKQDERGFYPLSDCLNLSYLDLRGISNIPDGSLNDILFNGQGTLLISKTTEMSKEYKDMLLSSRWRINIT
jgi:hypothetical protein